MRRRRLATDRVLGLAGVWLWLVGLALSRGLTVLQQLPEERERDQQELLLQRDLGPQLIITKGWGAVEVKHAFSRARDLSKRVNDPAQLLGSLMGLFSHHFSQAELKTAHRMAGELLRLTKEVPIDAVLLGAQMELGMSSLYMGNSFSARQYLERCLELYDARLYRGQTFLDIEVSSLSLLSHALWLLGYPDQAVDTSRRAVGLARQLAQPFSLAYALQYMLILHWLAQDSQATQRVGQELFRLAQQYGFSSFSSLEATHQGWLLLEAGRAGEGMRRIVAGLEGYRSVQIALARPCFLSILAQAYGKAGQAEDGLRVLSQAQELVRKTGERWYEAELYRLRAEMGWQESQRAKGKSQRSKLEDEAEESLQRGLHIARRQEAKSLELRVATRLARLWLDQRKTTQARQLLSEVYAWFSEGFETADLRAARVLLDEIGAPPASLSQGEIEGESC